MLRKIISGGQTGADRAGLKVAKALGLESGGMMPKGFLAQDGNHPEFAKLYGMKEHTSATYPPRTFINAQNSDATVRFAVDFQTSGEKLTYKAIQASKKPYFDVYILGNTQPEELTRWLTDNKVVTLNVAGNAERRQAGIEDFTFAFLMAAITTTIDVETPSTITPQEISFTKVALPYGWLGNMSPHAVIYGDKQWRTTEALFQALRFNDEKIIEEIRAESSPMSAKMKAKSHKEKMIITPGSDIDINNMRIVLQTKIDQHPQLEKELIATGNATIIEDCSSRRPSIWGAQHINGIWVGDNLLGKLWMELRDSLTNSVP